MYGAVLVVAGLVAAIGIAAAGVGRRFGATARSPRATGPTATGAGLADARALHRAFHPRHHHPGPGRVRGGLAVGTPLRGGAMITTGPEASLGAICPPRTGKSASAISHILDAPAAVLATSSKPELLLATGVAREHSTGQPTVVYDPLGMCGWDHTVRWSPLVGCADPKVAMRRAEALMAGTNMDHVTDGGFWRAAATMCCAAACTPSPSTAAASTS